MGQHLMSVFLLVLFTSIQGAQSWDVKIDIQPQDAVALLDDVVSISCDIDSHVQDIVLISIAKDGKDPIVVLKQNVINVTYKGQDVSRYQAEGSTDKTGVRRYLTLNVTHPKNEDSGTYSCKLLYLDQLYAFKEDVASDTLTVNSHLKIQRMENTLSSLLQKVSNLESENKELQEGMNNLTDKVTSSSAFSATVSSDTQLSAGQIVVFPTVLMNQGNNYDNKTGVYTAPKKGLYAFNLGYLMNRGAGYADISIQKNNVELARGYVKSDRYTQTACSTVVSLDQGDRVMCVVKQHGGPTLHGGLWYTVFNGYLIKIN